MSASGIIGRFWYPFAGHGLLVLHHYMGEIDEAFVGLSRGGPISLAIAWRRAKQAQKIRTQAAVSKISGEERPRLRRGA